MAVASSISNILNTKLRFTGMASGLDTDAIVQQMIRVQQAKVDKVKQEKQLLEWKRDDYRSIINMLRSFKDEFFDVLKPATYMRSSSTYYAYKVKTTDENVATAKSNGKVAMMEHTIKVEQLAEKAKMESRVGELGLNGLSMDSKISEVANSLGLNLEDNKLSLEINGEEIKISADKTLNDLISAINNSDAGVRISYSSFLDKFIVESKATGADEKIDVISNSNAKNLFYGLGFDVDEVKYGKNAKFKLDGKKDSNGQEVITEKNSNTFTIDGVTYTLTGVGEAKITLTQDTDAIYEKIKSFIDKYNEIVEKITTKVTEKRPRSGGTDKGDYYLPLTDEQREAMTEDEIKKWEEKAKTGLLRNDSLLHGVLERMRSAMNDLTEAGGLFSIGISTGSWRNGAKLFIDEDKLKKAIEDNLDKVVEIFTKTSEISYSPDNSSELRDKRYKESGVVERLFDVLQDYIRTTRSESGQKGLLLEKAGLVGDVTEYQNTLTKQINEKQDYIQELINKLYEKQESLYIKFAYMETALSRMSAQSSWFTQNFNR